MTIAIDDGQAFETNGVAEYDAYFGTPTHDDHILFELMTVGVFQVGLSWQAAASKLPMYRRVFAGMAIDAVAAMDLEVDVERIANVAGMIGNHRKIRATIQNARAIKAIQQEFGSYAAYLWQFVHGVPLQLPVVSRDEIATQSTMGSAVAHDLKRRGCQFVGPVVTHMFLKAAGILQDEILDN